MRGRKEYYDKKQKNKQMLIDAMNKTHKVGQKNNTHVTLIKDHDDYHLVNDEQFIIGTTDESILSCTDKYKLSIKNCQAIEHGYDLDELIDKYCRGNSKIEDDFIKKGFQKALELIGDKKYSEEDVRTAILFGQGMELWKEELQINDFIQSLQQTEWDVEIEMVNILENGYKNQPVNTIGFIAEYKSVPKLDENGCLILKKI